MAKSMINTTMRKTVIGTLNLDGNEPIVEIEDMNPLSFKYLFSKFNGEQVRISVTLSNDELDGD